MMGVGEKILICIFMMGVGEKILICIFMIGVAVFFIGAGIAIVWTVVEDTALGRVIDEIMEERIERWKERASNGEDIQSETE